VIGQPQNPTTLISGKRPLVPIR